jgi:hypothetical protein
MGDRTNIIEVFSTFFDRMSSTHPNRDWMIKELYYFKDLVYNNDSSVIENYFTSLQ